jgi:hypothetical protein
MTKLSLTRLTIDTIVAYAAAFATAWMVPFDVAARSRMPERR